MKSYGGVQNAFVLSLPCMPEKAFSLELYIVYICCHTYLPSSLTMKLRIVKEWQ